MKIAILGGGISGCALARMLAEDDHDVTVLEKSERVGGLCKSRQIDGFTFDEAGGHIIFSKDKDVLQWQLDRCGGDAARVGKVRMGGRSMVSDAEARDGGVSAGPQATTSAHPRSSALGVNAPPARRLRGSAPLKE